MSRIRGFTLLELMMVVAIIGILTAIALPSYKNYVRSSKRTAAISGLTILGSQEASYYTTNNQYTASLTTLGYASDPMPVPDATNPAYTLSVRLTATGFTLSATPQGDQVNDTCGTFTFDALGNKGSSGSVSTCWKQ